MKRVRMKARGIGRRVIHTYYNEADERPVVVRLIHIDTTSYHTEGTVLQKPFHCVLMVLCSATLARGSRPDGLVNGDLVN